MSSYGGAATTILVVTWSQALVASIMVALRIIYARTRAGVLRWDLIWVVLGTLVGIGAQINFVFLVLNGIGNHIQDVALPNLWVGLEHFWIGLLAGIPSVLMAKFSIIALLLPLTSSVQLKRRRLLWAVGAVLSIVTLIQIPITLTQCTPHNKLWFRLLPGTCNGAVAANNYGLFQGSIAVLSDIFLALYPATIVYNLQISFREKIWFSILMAGGLIPATAALIRTIYIRRIIRSSDPTYDLAPFVIWAQTEVWCIIILSSIPPLRPLIIRIVKPRKSLSGRSGSNMSATAGRINRFQPQEGARSSKIADAMSKSRPGMLVVVMGSKDKLVEDVELAEHVERVELTDDIEHFQ